jgi:hypothetical protein
LEFDPRADEAGAALLLSPIALRDLARFIQHWRSMRGRSKKQFDA